ncbi:HAD family phosphatase [bacterium]|nr:HAD family phosphatase [bacterium]
MIKLIATDIDGTILIPEGEFTDKVKSCIKKLDESGIKVVLVTGRMNAAAKLIAQELGLKTPVVSYQGGLIKEYGNTLYERYLTEVQTKKIIEWGKEANIHLNLYNDDILYSESDDYEIKRYCNNQHTTYTVKPFSKIEKNKVNKILAIDYNNPDRITKYEKELPKLFPELYIIKSTPYFLEFSNPEASKYCAVKFLQKYWNLRDDEILTIGDQNNDIALLQAGGIKIAMGNATEELKSCADYTTDTVFNDGFVKAIKKFCNI